MQPQVPPYPDNATGRGSEKKADEALFKDLKRVRGKNRLFFAVAEAAVAAPDDTVREVVFPVVPEQPLKNLVREGRATVAYDQQVVTTMRKSYSHHYRRMLPALLEVLAFASNNESKGSRPASTRRSRVAPLPKSRP